MAVWDEVFYNDDGDSDDDGDKGDDGGSVWLFKHFHHKFAREGTLVSLELCNAFFLDCFPVLPVFTANHVPTRIIPFLHSF